MRKVPREAVLDYALQESAEPETCDQANETLKYVVGNETNFIVRQFASGGGVARSWFVDADSQLHPIPDGGTYVCLAQRYYVLDGRTDGEISRFGEEKEPATRPARPRHAAPVERQSGRAGAFRRRLASSLRRAPVKLPCLMTEPRALSMFAGFCAALGAAASLAIASVNAGVSTSDVIAALLICAVVPVAGAVWLLCDGRLHQRWPGPTHVIAGALAFAAMGLSLMLVPTVGLFMVPGAFVLLAAVRASRH